MDKVKLLGKLLEAVDESMNEHKNAGTKEEYLYFLGRKEAYQQVVKWIEEGTLEQIDDYFSNAKNTKLT